MNQRQIDALNELSQKTLREIQAETARAWAYRAWAASTVSYMRFDAIEYTHEALEHAALCGDDSVLAEVRAIIAGKL